MNKELQSKMNFLEMIHPIIQTFQMKCFYWVYFYRGWEGTQQLSDWRQGMPLNRCF